jgi:hypothetical protein
MIDLAEEKLQAEIDKLRTEIINLSAETERAAGHAIRSSRTSLSI